MQPLPQPEPGIPGASRVPNTIPSSPLGSPQGGFPETPSLLDPTLLKAARHIYRTFYEVHPEVVRRPIGVAIGRSTHRGKLIFGDKPVLLPHECFIPLSQIEPGLH
nr:hypothetical protein [Romeria gracilis]